MWRWFETLAASDQFQVKRIGVTPVRHGRCKAMSTVPNTGS